MRGVRRAGFLVLLPLAAGLVGCGTQTLLVTNWTLPGGTGEDFAKLAVIGIMHNKTESTAFETSMAAKLEDHGVQTIPGFSFMEDAKNLTKAEMEKRVAGTGADAVLIFKVIAVDKSSHYVPPTTYVTPDDLPDDDWWSDEYWGYYNPYPYHYWGYWYPAWQVVTTPAYWETSKTFVVQSSLYRASDDKLVWTATSDTYDPMDPADLANSLAKIVYKKLEKARLVVGR